MLGEELAKALLAQGAGELLKALYQQSILRQKPMLFINTRPQDRAEALTQALQQQHIEVIDLPLLQLSAQPWSEQLAN